MGQAEYRKGISILKNIDKNIYISTSNDEIMA